VDIIINNRPVNISNFPSVWWLYGKLQRSWGIDKNRKEKE